MAFLLTAAAIVVAFMAVPLAQLIGLIGLLPPVKTVNPDGTIIIEMAVPLQRKTLVEYLVLIPLLLLAASRLRVNPLDALALRLPARPWRALLVIVALLVLVYVLRFGEHAFWLVWEALEGTPHIAKVTPGLRHVIMREGLLLAIVGTTILAPVAEELVFRGMLLQSLVKTRLGFWGAALLTSLPFAAIHIQMYGGILESAGIVFTGLVLALALRQTGSLWASIVLHVAVNSVALAALYVGM
jgi:membrane protease YdiL (CAAX protease family)